MFSTNARLAATVRANMIDALGPDAPADEARIIVDMNESCAVLHGCVRSWAEHETLERRARTAQHVHIHERDAHGSHEARAALRRAGG